MFCRQCGKEIPEGSKFCPSCGAQIGGQAQTRTAPPAKRTQSVQDARNNLMIGAAGLGGLAVLSLMLNDVLGLVIAAISCAAAYLGGIKKLDEGDVQTAKSVTLVLAVVVAIVGAASLLVAKSFLGLLDIAVAAPLYMAWSSMS